MSTPPVETPAVVKLVTRDFTRDPYPALRRIREERAATPVDSAGIRMWIVTRYEDARRLLADPDICKDVPANQDAILRASVLRPEKLRGVPLALRRHMLDRDEPDHTRLRSLVSAYFTGTAVQAMRAGIETAAAELLDGLPFGQPIDLVDRFCRPLARSVVAKLLGIAPDDPTPFPEWVNNLLTSLDKNRLNSSAASLVEYIANLLRRKAAEPADDITSALATALAAGELTEVEASASVQLLMNGGLEPLNGIANAVHALLHNPRQLAATIADLGLVSNCIDETLRYESPFRMLTPRYSRTPVDLGDVVIPANEMILISVAAAGRDPARFERPDEFDLSRNARAHLGFGRGVHRCLGAHLGHLEMHAALTTLLSRAPGIRLAAPDKEVEWLPGIFMRRLRELSVVLA